MAKMGRPKKEIDKDQFEGLCAIQCTLEEMCAFFHVTKPTLERWCKKAYDGNTFFTVFKEKRVAGKISLRRAGFKLAQTNAAVWIFHAKNDLGMKDIPDSGEGQDKPKPIAVHIVGIDGRKHNSDSAATEFSDTAE